VNVVVVFDTNILFSGLGWRGLPFACLDLARSGHIQSVTCAEILEELDALLRDKRELTLPERQRVRAEILSFSRVVIIPGTLADVLADPDDHSVLECAVEGQATHIVTGDHRHLLPLRRYQTIDIVTASDFIRFVSEQTD
jgi:putative PIN family toxin of toxin-antitoxin system